MGGVNQLPLPVPPTSNAQHLKESVTIPKRAETSIAQNLSFFSWSVPTPFRSMVSHILSNSLTYHCLSLRQSQAQPSCQL